MIVMIIFLVLTVVFIVGTAIYLNYNKNAVNNSIKQTTKTDTNEKGSKKNKKQLSNILQIKIKDNIVCLGNRYSCIIRLGNIDYNMLSVNEQDSIENVLIQTSLAIDYPIQFFSTTEFIDTSKVISLIRENKTTNLKIQELMENKSISVIKNYAIISYDGTYENAVDELNRRALSFTGNLIRAKIMCDILPEDELYNLIYRELNKNSALNISNLKEGGKNLYVGKKQKAKRNKHI